MVGNALSICFNVRLYSKTDSRFWETGSNFLYGTLPTRKLLLAFRKRSKQTFMLAYLFPIVGTDIQQNAQQSVAVHDWQGPAAHWLR